MAWSFTILACSIAVMAVVALMEHVRAFRLSRLPFEVLVERLRPSQMRSVVCLSLEAAHPTSAALRTSSADKWELIGGAEGVKTLIANANVLIALASHAESWRDPEVKETAKQMRHDGLILRRIARELKFRSLLNLQISGRERYALSAAKTYHTMTNRLLTLYKTSHSGRLGRVSDGLWKCHDGQAFG